MLESNNYSKEKKLEAYNNICNYWDTDEMQKAWDSLMSQEEADSIKDNTKINMILVDLNYQAALTDLKIIDKLF